AGLRTDPLIATHDAVAGMTAESYRAILSEDVAAERLEEIRQATKGGYPLVGAALKEKLESAGRKLERRTPGPKRAAQAPCNSVPDPDLFSGGAVS
ncbi:MAG TPA: hypothetical protein VEB41_04670, partial [Burkholderiales bacterium]|nr:hypothetical protein [Burkholderiales bacterium]